MKYSVLLSKHVPAMTQSVSPNLRKLNGCWSGNERSWEWALMIEGLSMNQSKQINFVSYEQALNAVKVSSRIA